MPSQNANAGGGLIPALTGVRAIAAYMVFFHHMAHANAGLPLRKILVAGHTGVSLFFVLSGFLIAHNYGRLFAPGARWPLAEYFRKRFARIFPLYWLLLVVYGLHSYYYGVTHGPAYWFLVVTLLKGFSSQYAFAGIDQSWSLCVEELFYATAPLIFFLAYRRRLWVGLLALYGIAAAWIGLRHVFFPDMDWSEKAMFVLTYTFPGRALDFLVGIQLCRLVSSGNPPEIPRVLQNRLTAVAAAFLVSIILWINWINQSASSAWPLGATLVHQFLLPLAIAFFFYGLIREKSWIEKILASRAFQLLGKSSYAFYLLHDGVIATRIILVLRQIPIVNAFPVTALFLVLNALAILTYKFFEDPMRRWLGPKRPTPHLSQ